MKIRHNKKRNTAFVYEALIREGTSAILQKDNERKNKIVKIIKRHFKPGTRLRHDLECYRSLYGNQRIAAPHCMRIVREAALQRRLINPQELFDDQTALIHDINKDLDSAVFGNFVPNYKSLATISQMFSPTTAPKDKVLLETMVINGMISDTEEEVPGEIDSVVVETFIKKFNTKYDVGLLEEQKKLLNYYITSFVDNSLELKMFLNEEISRLKTKLTEATMVDCIASDETMVDKTKAVVQKLDEFKNESVSEEVLLTVLKAQSLVKEVFEDGNRN